MTEKEKKPASLSEALIAFKLLDIEILKQSTNPHFKSKYADLFTILDAVEVPLAKLGVIISSYSHYQNEQWVETTELEFGSEKKPSSFPLFGNDPQKIALSITYARRNNIQSLLNLAAMDDDGNAAASKAIKPTKIQPVIDPQELFKDLLGNVVDKALTKDAMTANWKARSIDIAKLKQLSPEFHLKLEGYAKDKSAIFESKELTTE